MRSCPTQAKGGLEWATRLLLDRGIRLRSVGYDVEINFNVTDSFRNDVIEPRHECSDQKAHPHVQEGNEKSKNNEHGSPCSRTGRFTCRQRNEEEKRSE